MELQGRRSNGRLASTCMLTAALLGLPVLAAAQIPVNLALATSVRMARAADDADVREVALTALLRRSIPKDPQVRSAAALYSAAQDRVAQARSRL